MADEPVVGKVLEVVEEGSRGGDGAPGFVKGAGEGQQSDGCEIEIEGRKDAEDAADVEAFEGDGSVADLFGDEETANHKTADDEKDSDPLRARIGEEVAQWGKSEPELGMLEEEEVVQEDEQDAHRAPSV